MARKSRYEARIEDYVDAVRERDSYKPQPGEEQTEARQSKLKLAESRVKLCYSVLRGQDLGEARRRLEVQPVHNHGSEDGPGLACRESVIAGRLRGACLVDTTAR